MIAILLILAALGAVWFVCWCISNEVRHRRNMRAREARIGFYKVHEES